MTLSSPKNSRAPAVDTVAEIPASLRAMRNLLTTLQYAQQKNKSARGLPAPVPRIMRQMPDTPSKDATWFRMPSRTRASRCGLAPAALQQPASVMSLITSVANSASMPAPTAAANNSALLTSSSLIKHLFASANAAAMSA